MAEAWANELCSDIAVAASAGLEPSELNPLAVEAMREAGVDISHAETKGVLDLFKQGLRYDRVIGVCDQEAAERCPLFPGMTKRIYWSFEDPAKTEGSDEERLAKMREVRDHIKAQIEEWREEEKVIIAEALEHSRKKQQQWQELGAR